MKTFIRGWEYEPPALQQVVGLLLILAFIGQFIFAGPVADVLLGVFVFCVTVLIAANRSWEHMTPLRWALLAGIVIIGVVNYITNSPVTHMMMRVAFWVFIVWFIANRPHIRPYWREG